MGRGARGREMETGGTTSIRVGRRRTRHATGEGTRRWIANIGWPRLGRRAIRAIVAYGALGLLPRVSLKGRRKVDPGSRRGRRPSR
jgi:hypothetical protein